MFCGYKKKKKSHEKRGEFCFFSPVYSSYRSRSGNNFITLSEYSMQPRIEKRGEKRGKSSIMGKNLITEKRRGKEGVWLRAARV